jgi:hypothetical protein
MINKLFKIQFLLLNIYKQEIIYIFGRQYNRQTLNIHPIIKPILDKLYNNLHLNFLILLLHQN